MNPRIVRRPLPEVELNAGDLHPVLSKIYSARGVTQAEALDHSLTQLLSYRGLMGIDGAVSVLVDALHADAKVLIVGDFDADGATASALGVLGLRALGFSSVDYLVPNRFEFGYGLTPEIVDVARERDPQVLVTVDNGISSLAGVRAARDAGIDVVVTDHHLPGAELPAATAIVNPNQPGCAFPSKVLAGVGVMFYLLAALRAQLDADGWFQSARAAPPNLASFLDLVALGTVADVVALDHNNRVFVEQGLRRIRAGRCRPGITALLEVGRRSSQRAVASDLGFAVGPRLNAAGRLTDMSFGIECLLENDANRAREMAVELDALNRERRDIEAQMQREALSYVAGLDDRCLPHGLCVFEEDWHAGVVGIVAARVRERFHRPVVAFARDADNNLKGSARSIAGLHIRDALDAVSVREPGLIVRFGGHAMAAGLTIPGDALARFRDAFDAVLKQWLSEEQLEGVLLSDGELAAEFMTLDVARVLRDGGPWGQGFPEPVFDGEFDVLSRRVVGERHLKLRLRRVDDANAFDAIAFNMDDESWPPSRVRVHLAYRLDVNEYRAMESAQMVVEALADADDAEAVVPSGVCQTTGPASDA